jgi:hypothetical protein
MAISEEQAVEATQRGQHRTQGMPRAIAARYDRTAGKVVIELSNGLTIMFRPDAAEGIEAAKPAQLRKIVISPSGFGLHFTELDADLYIPGLLSGFFGSARWHAAQMGRVGGSATSEAKQAASRVNGLRGGRPRKNVPPRTHEFPRTAEPVAHVRKGSPGWDAALPRPKRGSAASSKTDRTEVGKMYRTKKAVLK